MKWLIIIGLIYMAYRYDQQEDRIRELEWEAEEREGDDYEDII